MATAIQILRGTAAEWIADDIVIPQGEFAIQVDGSDDFTGVLKVGNGVDAYSVLASFNVGGGSGILFSGWNFDGASIVDSDPGSGNFRLNNADPALATFIYIDDENHLGQDLSEILDDLAIGSNVGIQQVSNGAKSLLYDVTGAIVDGTGYRKIPVDFVSQGGGGDIDDTELQAFAFIPVGSALTGSNEPERIDFESDLDTVHKTRYITPVQFTDISSNGISAVVYQGTMDDGVYDFAGDSGESVSLATLNTWLDGVGDSLWVEVWTLVTLSRASSIRRVVNLD